MTSRQVDQLVFEFIGKPDVIGVENARISPFAADIPAFRAAAGPLFFGSRMSLTGQSSSRTGNRSDRPPQ